MSRRKRLSCGVAVVALAIGAGSLALLGGRSDAPERSPEGGPRIVSLAPSVTEIIFALGGQGGLVGVTDRCDYPPEARDIACVGGFGVPSVERLLAVRPNLVIAAGLERPEVASVLEQSGIEVLDLRIENLDEVFEAIVRIGRAVDRSRKAETLVAAMRARLDAVALRTGRKVGGSRPRVYIEIGEQPLVTAGGPSFLDDMVARAGGVNVAHAISPAYPTVDPEQVVAWNPDVILMAAMQSAGGAASRLPRRIGWSEIAAVKRGRIIDDVHPDLLFRPGPRLVDAVEAIAERLDGMEGSR